MALTIEAKITRHAKINNDLILRVTRGEVSNPEDHALIITKAPTPSQASDRYAAIIQAVTDDVVIGSIQKNSDTIPVCNAIFDGIA